MQGPIYGMTITDATENGAALIIFREHSVVMDWYRSEGLARMALLDVVLAIQRAHPEDLEEEFDD